MRRLLKRLYRRRNNVPSPLSPNHYRILGDAARNRREWDAAGRHYAFHLEFNRQDFDIWVQFGHALKEQGLLDQAGLAYEQASLLNEGDADLWLNRGHLEKLRGDFRSSRECYTRSYALNRSAEVAIELNALDVISPQTSEARAPSRSDAGDPASRGLGPARFLRPLDINNSALLLLEV